jgi:hypothetical protein
MIDTTHANVTGAARAHIAGWSEAGKPWPN